MNDIHLWIQWVWGTTWALILLTLCVRGINSLERIFRTDSPTETLAFRTIMLLNMILFALHLFDIVNFSWWGTSAFGIAGYASYRSLRLILLKEKAPAQ
jgi:hypothetical protein